MLPAPTPKSTARSWVEIHPFMNVARGFSAVIDPSAVPLRVLSIPPPGLARPNSSASASLPLLRENGSDESASAEFLWAWPASAPSPKRFATTASTSQFLDDVPFGLIVGISNFPGLGAESSGTLILGKTTSVSDGAFFFKDSNESWTVENELCAGDSRGGVPSCGQTDEAVIQTAKREPRLKRDLPTKNVRDQLLMKMPFKFISSA